jgi:accessory colonization factor AcfC
MVVLGLVLAAGGAGAADIKVLSTGNMQTILGQIAPDFERMSGHKLMIEWLAPRIKTRAETEADLTTNATSSTICSSKTRRRGRCRCCALAACIGVRAR